VSASTVNSSHIAALIDHTLLKPEASRGDVARLCVEALQHRFASVCVNPVFTSQVSEALRDSPVKTCTVVGFPLGANLSSTKVYEAQMALDDGAQEIDMVIHVGGLKAREDAAIRSELESLVAVCRQRKSILKVILETSLLNDVEKERACNLVRHAGADFVKTSTGFSSSGATAADVALMRRIVGPHMGVKASGGIRTLSDVLKMVDAGATRIGTSNGVTIMQEALQMFGA
jgi:deoxyribose-phosphate aldolase